MDTHALERLEFDQVRRAVAAWSRSDRAQRRILEDEPATSRTAVLRLQEDVGACRQALEQDDLPGEISFPEITQLLHRVEKEGAVLEAGQLHELARFAQSLGRLRRFLEKRLPEGPLRERVQTLPELSAFHKEIRRYIDIRGEILERHIPELKRLSSAIRSAQSKVEQVAGQYMRERNGDYWNMDHPVLREGRIVLPLKSRYQSRVDGVVHEHSQTGQTVFVEPSVLVRANNELRAAEDRYRQELFRILKDLSAVARRNRAELARGEDLVVELDAVYARARYSQEIDGVRPEITRGDLHLPQMRHPLLGAGVVPIDVILEGDTRHLIITGPNTGGKTVALKTIGLAALMHQFGIQIPALPGAALPIFDQVFADIGDEQSLEQSLSTFSGHMRQISRIVTTAGRKSLVLLDELGAGTDPADGGALALAILDELRERGCHSVVTTHHGALKSYGYTHNAVRNGSVEFDLETLSPTYRLLIGIPGSSHGVTIAERNGLPGEVIARARAYAEEGRGDAAEIIQRLGEEEERLHREREDLASRLRSLEQQEAEMERRAEGMREQERRLREGELGEFQQFAAQARSRLENLVRELREGEITREKTKKVRRFAEDLEAMARDEERRIADLGTAAGRRDARAVSADGAGGEGLRPSDGGAGTGAGAGAKNREAAQEGAVGPVSFEPGMEVLLKSSRKRGVLQRRDRKGWVVATDSVKLTVPEEELEALRSAAGRTPAAAPSVQLESAGEASRASYEIDLRGSTLAEAIDRLDSQIDAALMTGLYRFGIIHGKGSGVLQRGIRDHLARSSVVAEFNYASPEEGGYGKTVVELKRE